MDSCGNIYGSKEFSDDCIFNETMQDNYNIYASSYHSNSQKNFYLALNKLGQPRKTHLPTNKDLGKLATYARSVTLTVPETRTESLIGKLFGINRVKHGLKQLCDSNKALIELQAKKMKPKFKCGVKKQNNKSGKIHNKKNGQKCNSNNNENCQKKKNKQKKELNNNGAGTGGNIVNKKLKKLSTRRINRKNKIRDTIRTTTATPLPLETSSKTSATTTEYFLLTSSSSLAPNINGEDDATNNLLIPSSTESQHYTDEFYEANIHLSHAEHTAFATNNDYNGDDDDDDFEI